MVTSTPTPIPRKTEYEPIHQFTSKPSRSQLPAQSQYGLWYAYFNHPGTREGSEATVSFPEEYCKYISPGVPFSSNGTPIAGRPTTFIEYNEDLKCSVLVFDNVGSQSDMEVPAHSEINAEDWQDPDFKGYNDHDAEHSVSQYTMRNGIPRAGTQARAARKNITKSMTLQSTHPRNISDTQKLKNNIKDADLAAAIEEVAHGYLYMEHLTGVSKTERTSQLTAQKLVACVLIPYFRSKGIELSEEDVKALQYA